MNTQQASYPPGSRILARDEEWLVRSSELTDRDGYVIRATGVTEFVQGVDATFFTGIETIEVLRPEDTRLVPDNTPHFRRSRLFLEAVLRRTPLPRSAKGLALADSFLIDPLSYQLRPAEAALAAQRPRLLLADVVGLGKTLEIGLTLAELIRRGRGERILVVTPQHILEQFQHELWTRFSIPLVRLDSVGIERIQREIPAGRNPFTYFKRVIVSIDTLKNVGMYGHHLEKTDWDAVVIDESHNLIGQTSLRNRLARRLAEHTDALLLASATPHGGDKRAFAGLIHMLDPTAISDVDNYQTAHIEHLYLRRTKISSEVRDQIGDRWAARTTPLPIACAAKPAEEAVFAELVSNWLTPAGNTANGRDHLFSYTLLKAYLSSHKALAETVRNRLGNKQRNIDPAERGSLTRLAQLASAVDRTRPAKLEGLIDELRTIGVKPGGDVRVVVFSERVATIAWLSTVVPSLLGLAPDAVRVMHGGKTDTEQQRIVEEFSLAGSSVRLLFTSDIASEGVNLHRECHHLIHYDIPWSLIRIEQRNGRIDRYGQVYAPQFRALILTSSTPGAKDDTTVAQKLLEREQAAHQSFGTAEGVTGLYDAKKEEDRLVKDLLRGRTVEQSLDEYTEPDVLSDLLANVGAVPTTSEPARTHLATLFQSTSDFVDEALREIYRSPEDDIDLSREDQMLALTAPDDLIHRLADLPRSYLADQRTDGQLRLRLTFDKAFAQAKLDQARKGGKTSWPEVTYVSDIHPIVDWLVDKVLVRLGRQEAPVLLADVDGPTFLVQGILSNAFGQPTMVRWLGISGLPGIATVQQMTDVLDKAQVKPSMPNPGFAPALDDLQLLVPEVLDAAREWFATERQAAGADDTVGEPLLRVLAVLQKSGSMA